MNYRETPAMGAGAGSSGRPNLFGGKQGRKLFDRVLGHFQAGERLVPGVPGATGPGQLDALSFQGRRLGVEDRLRVQADPLMARHSG